MPTLADDKPGTNEILSNVNDTELANNISSVDLNYENHDVSKIFILFTY